MSDRDTWTRLEETTRDALAQRDVNAAVTSILDVAGAPLFGFVVRIVGDETAASDAFQVFAIRLWEGLPKFGWRSSLRTWLYTVARNAAYRATQDPFAKRGQRLETGELAALAGRLQRTATARWQQTREKTRLWDLIEALEPADRELMVLRLGRRMSWNDVAQVMAGAEVDEAELKKRAAAARKRYERVKARLAAALKTADAAT